MSLSRRGAVIYCDSNASKSARRLRARGMVLGVTFIVMGILFLLGDGEPRVVLIIFGSIVLAIGVIILAEGHSVRDFRIHERGIRLAGHGLPDALGKDYIPFARISSVGVSKRDLTMTINCTDRRGRKHSVVVWRTDVEKDIGRITEILSGLAELEVMDDG